MDESEDRNKGHDDDNDEKKLLKEEPFDIWLLL